MASKDKYMTMKASEVTDEYGNLYPDLATFPINEIDITTRPVARQLTENDCLRFFDLIYTYYSVFTLYDDLTLWLNDILYISDTDTNFNKNIKLYTKQDIDSWFLLNV